MKRLVFAFIMLALTSSAFAETALPITKGNFLLGGSSNSYWSNSDDNKQFSFSVYPDLGYFFFDNIALGVETSASYYYYSFPSWKEESTYFGAAMFGKYYANNGFLAMLSLGGDFSKDHKPHFYFQPRIGYAYFINSKVSLEGMVGSVGNYYDSEFDLNQFTFSVGFQVFL